MEPIPKLTKLYFLATGKCALDEFNTSQLLLRADFEQPYPIGY